jgi:hypothetical protein
MTDEILILLILLAIVGGAYFVISQRRRKRNSIAEPAPVPAAQEIASENEPVLAAAEKERASDDEAPFVQKVQVACQIAGMSAGYPDDEYERERFEEYVDKGLSIARGIKDDFYRSAAIHLIVSVLIKDSRLDQAQELIHEINVDMIEEEANEELSAARG